MFQTVVYDSKQRDREIEFSEVSEVIKDPSNLIWVDLEKPTEEELNQLRSEFDFHPLAIEDVQHGHQRPKIDEYGGYFFLVVNAIRYDAETMDLSLVEIDFFIGRNYVVTVHDGTCKSLDDALARVRAHPRVLQEGLGLLAYTIMDTIIDDFMPILDTIDEQVDQIEESIFHDFNPESINTIFRLKREMLKVRRNVGHMRDVFNILARRDQPLFSPQAVIYFQDVYDHLYRITDAVDIYRDTLTSALEAYISLNANKLNEIMKKFAGISIMLMTPALIAGIYGMNFKPAPDDNPANPLNMPELGWHYGYLWSIFLMVVSSLGWWIYFRRKKWL